MYLWFNWLLPTNQRRELDKAVRDLHTALDDLRKALDGNVR